MHGLKDSQKIKLTRQKVFPPPTVGVPSASKSPSALASRAGLMIIIMDGGEIKQRATTRCWRALSPLATISGNDLGRRLPRLQRQASYHGGDIGGRDVTLGKVKQQQTIKNNKQFQGKLGQLPPRR